MTEYKYYKIPGPPSPPPPQQLFWQFSALGKIKLCACTHKTHEIEEENIAEEMFSSPGK